MTRKDYVLIAAALLDARPTDDETYILAAHDTVALALARALSNDNARFDRERFLKACGVSAP